MSSLDEIVALCVNRGFVYPSSEIYGGINGFWDYGPLGCEMRSRIKALWWQRMVRERDDVVGLDSSIIANPATWIASGHVANFNDPMVDCRSCKQRFRADQLDGVGSCPKSADGQHDLTDAKQFNLMLRTRIGAAEDSAIEAYLRPETCQSIFLDFRRVQQGSRLAPPFGIAQIGKAFRNEITPRNFIFRSREFEQMEMQFFVPHAEAGRWFEYFREYRMRWLGDIGLPAHKLRWHEHGPGERAHYARAAFDVEFEFPFGWQELEGVHDRGDHDLRSHSEHSGKDLSYTNQESKERYLPYVIETSIGVDRLMLALLTSAFTQDEVGGEPRSVMRLAPAVAPIQVAVLPLSKKLGEPAARIAAELRRRFSVASDTSGAIGRRYRRQDEIGTPFCVTYDFESEQDQQVTVRERDSTAQTRIPAARLASYLSERIFGYP